MDRLEYIRIKFDKEISKLQDQETRKFAYIHAYGVAQHAAMLAQIRHVDIELLCIAAMLHDVALYAQNCPKKDHAVRSSQYAKTMLEESKLFQENEITIITHAILVHSDKRNRHDTLFAETLKDSDVLQHYLYNVNIPVTENDRVRLFYLLEDFKIKR